MRGVIWVAAALLMSSAPAPIASTRASAIRTISSLPRPRLDCRGRLKPSQVPCVDVRACLGS